MSREATDGPGRSSRPLPACDFWQAPLAIRPSGWPCGKAQPQRSRTNRRRQRSVCRTVPHLEGRPRRSQGPDGCARTGAYSSNYRPSGSTGCASELPCRAGARARGTPCRAPRTRSCMTRLSLGARAPEYSRRPPGAGPAPTARSAGTAVTRGIRRLFDALHAHAFLAPASPMTSIRQHSTKGPSCPLAPTSRFCLARHVPRCCAGCCPYSP